MIKRLDIKTLLQDPSTRQQLRELAVAGILPRFTYVPHTISMSNINSYVKLAQRKYAGPHISIEAFAEISRMPEEGGAWVRAWVWVDDPDPERGPAYTVWITNNGWQELDAPSAWTWWNYYTHFDDPDGIGARRAAHDHARRIRDAYPRAFVAVRRADKGLPLPVRCDP